jgi:hypothetical protein
MAFYYFDSSGTYNKRAALRIAQKLLPLLPPIHEMNIRPLIEIITGPSLQEISSQTSVQKLPSQFNFNSNQISKIPFYLMPTPQQPNSYDCGAYVLCIAEFIAKHLPQVNYDNPEKLIPLLHQEVTASFVQQKRAALRTIINNLSKKK